VTAGPVTREPNVVGVRSMLRNCQDQGEPELLLIRQGDT